MAHAQESHTKRIWLVFGFLCIITLVEVALGLAKPEALYFTKFLGTNLLNWIFIILTLVKAYYIVWAFMHLEGEKKWFRRVIVWTVVVYISYLVTLLLIEGSYLNENLKSLVNWNY